MGLNFEFDVFLAHNSLDKPHVRKISAKLRERGLKPWLDEEQIAPGKAFQDEIQKAIPQIKSAVIIIGSQGLGKWQKLELKSLISQFVEQNTPVIPVLLVGVNQIPDNLRFLKEFKWVNFEREDDSRAFYNLEWGITQVKPPSNTQTVTLTAEEWFNSGYNKGESGDYQGEIADCNQAIKLNPDFATAYNNRGLAKSNLGDNQGVIADCNQAIKLNPDFATAYNNRGLAKSDLGDNQGAISDYNQAINLNPDFATAYYNRGIAKKSLGDKQGAISDSQTAAQLYSKQGNMKMYKQSLDNIKYYEKGFWGRLFG